MASLSSVLFSVCITIIAAYTAGCASLSGDLSQSLDSQIGNPAPDIEVGHNRGFELHDVDAETYQLIWRRPDRCSFAMTVRKSDRIVIGWHYLEEPAPDGCTYFNTGA